LPFPPFQAKLGLLIDSKPRSNLFRRYLLAALAGAMLGMAYPTMGLAALAWLAPGMMLAIALGHGGWNGFRIGYVGGLSFHLVSLYWLLLIPVRFAPVIGWLVLSAYLALYQGVWVFLCWKLYPYRLDASGPTTPWQQFLTNRWAKQLQWTLTCAALWVAAEMVQARFLTGFPWNLLGVSQFRMTPLIQIASFTGVYGVSFLMIWFSVALVSASAVMVFRPARPRDWMAEIMPPIFVVVILLGYGLRQVAYAPASPASLKVALVQPSIPQEVIWDTAKSEKRFQQLIQLTRRALTNQPDLLVWPEAAVPNLFRYDTNIHVVVTNLVRAHDVWLVLGADDVVWTNGKNGQSDYKYYNCSFLINPQGGLERIYRKRKLVVFGEYVPFANWFPFLRDFTSVHGDFTPGDLPVPFLLKNLKVKLSVLICFEDIFPNFTRQYVDADTDFLLNLTNNGWFGESAAQWQHAANAVFRAVENGLPLVRCANNGLTCWVDAQGRIHDEYFPLTKDIYGAGFKIVRVPITAGKRRSPTVYRVYGDWFGWGCVAWSLSMILWALLHPRRGNL
jgi:apolipoprotein N-acyltransferase